MDHQVQEVALEVTQFLHQHLIQLHQEVEVVEMLGAERLVHGHLAGSPFTLRIDGMLRPPAPGQTLLLRVDAQRLHWFNPADGQRVEPA